MTTERPRGQTAKILLEELAVLLTREEKIARSIAHEARKMELDPEKLLIADREKLQQYAAEHGGTKLGLHLDRYTITRVAVDEKAKELHARATEEIGTTLKQLRGIICLSTTCEITSYGALPRAAAYEDLRRISM
jgi:hypothetical protein